MPNWRPCCRETALRVVIGGSLAMAVTALVGQLVHVAGV
jgi:hypothetical protein